MMNRIRLQSRYVNIEPKIVEIQFLTPMAAILDSEKKIEFIRRLVYGVKYYVHASFCPNWMNRAQISSQNVICDVKMINF